MVKVDGVSLSGLLSHFNTLTPRGLTYRRFPSEGNVKAFFFFFLETPVFGTFTKQLVLLSKIE